MATPSEPLRFGRPSRRCDGLASVHEVAYPQHDGFPVDDHDWDVGIEDVLALPYEVTLSPTKYEVGALPPVAVRRWRPAPMNVSLRPLEDRDLDTMYQQMTDPASVRMAAFTAEGGARQWHTLQREVAARRGLADRVALIQPSGTVGFALRQACMVPSPPVRPARRRRLP